MVSSYSHVYKTFKLHVMLLYIPPGFIGQPASNRTGIGCRTNNFWTNFWKVHGVRFFKDEMKVNTHCTFPFRFVSISVMFFVHTLDHISLHNAYAFIYLLNTVTYSIHLAILIHMSFSILISDIIYDHLLATAALYWQMGKGMARVVPYIENILPINIIEELCVQLSQQN